jgi:hypothetical protein
MRTRKIGSNFFFKPLLKLLKMFSGNSLLHRLDRVRSQYKECQTTHPLMFLFPGPLIAYLWPLILLEVEEEDRGFREGLMQNRLLIGFSTITYVVLLCWVIPVLKSLWNLFHNPNSYSGFFSLLGSWHTVQILFILVVHLPFTYWALRKFELTQTFIDQHEVLRRNVQMILEGPMFSIQLQREKERQLISIMGHMLPNAFTLLAAEYPDIAKYLTDNLVEAFKESGKYEEKDLKTIHKSIRESMNITVPNISKQDKQKETYGDW